MVSAARFGLLSNAVSMKRLLGALRTGDEAKFAACHVLRTVLFTDLSSWSIYPPFEALQHLLAFETTLNVLLDYAPAVLVKAMGDSHLLLCADVEAAVYLMDALQAARPELSCCAGIGYGPVVLCQHVRGRLDVFGEAVNAASRLGEDVAQGTQVLLTPAAYAQLPLTLQPCCAGMSYGAGMRAYLWRGGG